MTELDLIGLGGWLLIMVVGVAALWVKAKRGRW